MRVNSLIFLLTFSLSGFAKEKITIIHAGTLITGAYKSAQSTQSIIVTDETISAVKNVLSRWIAPG